MELCTCVAAYRNAFRAGKSHGVGIEPDDVEVFDAGTAAVRLCK